MVILDETNQAILKMIGLYRVGTRSTVARLLADGSEPDKRLARLVKEGLLRTHKGLPGNRSVFQLTKRGAGEIGVSPARGRVLGPASILKNLGVLLFCHVSGTERHRVEADQLGQALGVPLPDGAYCLCQIKGQALILDSYVPGAMTPISTVLRHLRKTLKSVKQNPVLAQAVKDLRYGFALVVPTKERRKAIMDALRTPDEGGGVPLIKRVRVWVEAVDELAALTGTAAPSLGRVRSGAGQNLLWTERQELTEDGKQEQ